MDAMREYAEQGGKLLAECGGMIYLSRSFTNRTGDKHYRMACVLPLDCTMEGARLHLGYRKMRFNGNEWRGHEFHYSDNKESKLWLAYRLRDALLAQGLYLYSMKTYTMAGGKSRGSAI